MKRLFLIMFFLFLSSGVVASEFDGHDYYGSMVKGAVRWSGRTPRSDMLAKIPYDDVCGKTPYKLVHFHHKRIKDVVVWLEPTHEVDDPAYTIGDKPWQGVGDGKKWLPGGDGKNGGLVISQGKCLFSPEMGVVPVGAPIEIVNIDRKDHWVVVKGRYLKKTDAVEQYGAGYPEFSFETPRVAKIPAGGRLTVYSSRPDVIYIQSGFHHWMRSFVVVTNSPHITITDRRGRFYLDGVVAGTYDLHAWNPYLGDNIEKIAVPEDAKRDRIYITYTRLLPAEYEYLEPNYPSTKRELRETHIDEIDP